MQFITNAKVFSEEMAEALKYSSEKGALYQRSVLLTLKENTLEFRTRTFETQPYREHAFLSTLPVDGREDGQVAVSSYILSMLISSYDNEDVEFKTTEKYLVIKQGKKRFETKLWDLDAKEMEFSIPKEDDFSPLSEDFCNAITKVVYATNKKEPREICRSVFFEYTDEKLHIVSTDGKRISAMSLHEKGKGKTLLPIEFATLMGKTKAQYICTEENRVIFKKDNRYYISSVYNAANYPNWKKIMPPKTDCEKLQVDKEELEDAVKRMSITAEPASHKIKLQAKDDKMTITSLSNDGEGKEVIPCTLETPFEKYFRFNFLTDILKVSTSKTLTIHYGKADNRPIMITDEDPCFRAAVCDMRES